MQWVCDFCGYIHDDGEPPEICPVCGEPRSRFSERYEDEEDLLEDHYSQGKSNDADDYYEEYDE
jgi:hypothetical protein